MNEPRQNSFSANTSAWRFVAGWNLKYPDVCETAIVSPVKAPQLLVRMLEYNEMIGQSFPGPGKNADRGRGTSHSEQHRQAANLTR
jgi:hypothetical protein